MIKLPSVMDYTVQETHIKGEYKDYLHRPLFDINIRLYRSSRTYKIIVNRVIGYTASMFDREFHDYPEIKGVSGANLGIPFNIIVVRCKDDEDNKGIPTGLRIMINPEVLKQSGKSRKIKSNCGSLVLDEPIEIVRRTKVKVSYHGATYKLNTYGSRDFHTVKVGPKRTKWFNAPESFTIQHEVDHNNGITILDRQVSE